MTESNSQRSRSSPRSESEEGSLAALTLGARLPNVPAARRWRNAALGLVLTALLIPVHVHGAGSEEPAGAPPGGVPGATPPGHPGIKGRGPRRPYLAVTHTIDYLVPSQLAAIATITVPNLPTAQLQFTRTTLVALNGTGAVANVATYVLGKGHVFQHAFQQIQPAEESFLLPFAHFGSDPNAPPSEWDAPNSPYVGETIVVASDVPVMVTGAVLEGFKDLFVSENFDFATDGSNESRRTLDVRQFDCNLPADFAKVSLFCSHFAPVPPPSSP